MCNQLKKNNILRKIGFGLVVFLFLCNVEAQEKKIAFSLKKYPKNIDSWWLKNNNFGKDIDKYNLDFIFNYSNSFLDINAYLTSGNKKNNFSNSIYFNEIFIKRHINKHTFIKFGKYYRDFSQYLNDDLSSGSILISNNAQAMPKFSLISSKIVKEKFYFKYGISNAFFEKSETYLKAPQLHEKFIYAEVKNNDWIWGIGFVHEAIWAGETVQDGKQPSKFSDFLKVLVAADGDREIDQPHANALGNHLGIWDFYLIKESSYKQLKIYYQHFFEDTSGLRFANRYDGIWGMELRDYIPKTNLLIEYLDTSNQNIDPPYVDDAYYNHYIYYEGWSYKNNTLGNPFISSNTVDPSKVLYLSTKSKIKEKNIFIIKLAKRIDTSEKIKYKLEYLTKLNHVDLNFELVSSENRNYGLVVGLSFFLNR
jgi:hypothetical protein